MNDDWIERYKDKMLRMTLTTLKDGRERSISICKEPDGSLSTTRTCIGTHCYVVLRECRGSIVGDFHTHPGSPPDPSDYDFYNAYKRGVGHFCIGSGNVSDLPPKKTKTGMTHRIGWGREGVPEVHCFKMGRPAFIDEWLKKHGIGEAPRYEGSWSMRKEKKRLGTDFSKKLSSAFYNAVWFRGEYLKEPLITQTKTFKGVRT